MMTTLEIELLGSPRITTRSGPVHLSRRKAIAILAYLVMTRQPQSREALTALLWPEFDGATARGNLRRNLSRLRQQLPGEVLLADRLQVALNPAAAVRVDVYDFAAALAAVQDHPHADGRLCAQCAQRLMAAAELYRDAFMAGFSLPDCAAFDEWLFFQREERRRDAAGVLQQLAAWCGEEGLFEEGISYARRWVSLDPWHEPAHRMLIKLYAWSDQQAAALRQYESCRQVLDEELGVTPEAETIALVELVRSRRLPPPQGEPVATAAPAGRAQTGTNLPAESTPFVGREKELAEIRRMLREEPDCRLLTLLGPGGIGKTRLALRAAAGLVDDFPEGVTFVPLAPVPQAENLIPALANSLNLSFIGVADLQAQLVDFLRDKRRLLVLDNFEHLTSGAGLLPAILAAAPGVKMLVTSRERLRLQAEWIREVAGLAFPEQETAAPGASYAAVRLFRQSARRVQPGFAEDAATEADVGRICRLVQGMPLAIELAATWVTLLTCGEIAAEIEKNLDFLAAELRDVPERQRSIEAVFQHSWNLAPATARGAFARLSVFRGGFSREAASAVAGASLAILAALADRSLIRRDGSGRYEIHELLRQYGAGRLGADAGEQGEIRRRHAAYYAGWMRRQQDAYYGGERERTTAGINREIDNVRAAWQWAVGERDADTLGSCAMSLFFFYETQGWYREGEAAFAAAVAALEGAMRQGDSRELELRANFRTLLTSLGWFRFRLADYDGARSLLQESLPVYRAVQDREGLWMATELAANVAYSLGQYDQARELVTQNLQHLENTGAQWAWAEGQSLTNLGRIAMARGDDESGLLHLGKGIALLRQVGDQLGTILSLHTMGRIYHARGDLAEAASAYQACLETGRAHDLPLGEAVALDDLGGLLFQQGAFGAAREHYQRSLAICRDIGDRRGRALAANHLGLAAAALGDYEDAGQHHEESRAICEQTQNQRGLALTLAYLGNLARLEKDFARAEMANEASASLCREIGYRKGLAVALQAGGDLALDRGDYEEAKRLIGASLVICDETGLQEGRVDCQIRLGRAARLLGDPEEARRYLQEALAGASSQQRYPALLEGLVELAALLLHEPDVEQALEIVVLAEQHPACTRQTQEQAGALRRELAARGARVTSAQRDVPGAAEAFTSRLLALAAKATGW